MGSSPPWLTIESREDALGSPQVEISCPMPPMAVSLRQQTPRMLQGWSEARCFQAYSSYQKGKNQCHPNFLCQEPADEIWSLAPASLELTPVLLQQVRGNSSQDENVLLFHIKFMGCLL